MKRYIFLLIGFLPLGLCAQAFLVDKPVHQVLTFYHNDYTGSGIKILTNIPVDNPHMPVIHIEGYNFEYALTMGIRLSWAVEGGQFIRVSAASTGGLTPDIWLSNNSGLVEIYLGTINGSNIRFKLSVFADGLGENPSWFDGWTAVDEPQSFSGSYEPVPYYNQFKDYVSIFGGMDAFYGYVGDFTTTNLNASSIINNVMSSNLVSSKVLEVKNKPTIDGTQATAPINLISRRTGGLDYKWTMQTSSTAGGSNVTPNGYDIWEYPGNIAPTARRRFVIYPSEKNGVNSGISPFVIAPNGNVAIGYADGATAINPTYANPLFSLAVNGTIGAKKLIIEKNGWPDYVFEPSYKLRPLVEVDNFIRKYRHLPEVPSAANVEKNGVDVVETQAALLMKVEELTLYLIEQEKRIKILEEELLQKKGTIHKK